MPTPETPSTPAADQKPAEKKSALALIQATTPVKPSADVVKVLLENLAKGDKSVEDAQKALDKANALRDTAVRKLAEAVGGKPVVINGVRSEFRCSKSDRIYLTAPDTSDTIVLS
jgi:hypothetical protein